MKKFSIVVPVYFNEETLPKTISVLLELRTNLPRYILELIFVDDGSEDNSLSIIKAFQTQFPEIIKYVKLTKNFGSMSAIQAGLQFSSGDLVGVISADLQDPPELFIEMLQKWEQGYKSVFAVRSDREEPFLQKFFSNFYYKLISKYAIKDYPSKGFDFLLMDRQVVEELLQINEKNTNIMSLTYWLGFESAFIPYVRRAREKGKSRWTLSKKIKLFIDTFVSFSYFPIRILSTIGFFVALAAFMYGLFIFFTWLFLEIEVLGWVPMMIVLTFTSGLQMTMLGVLGEYLWRTFDETRKRPPFIVDSTSGFSQKEEENYG